MKLIRNQIEHATHLNQFEKTLVIRIKRHRGHRGRDSLSSNSLRQSQSQAYLDLNHWRKDSIALSKEPALVRILIKVPPTNGVIEVLRRTIALLDNLVTKTSGDFHEETQAYGKRQNLSWWYNKRSKRYSSNLPPILEYPRHVRPWYINIGE